MGSIINVASVAGVQGVAYLAPCGLQMGRGRHHPHCRHRTVRPQDPGNVICPTSVNTPMVGLTFAQSLGGVIWGIKMDEIMADLTKLGIDDRFMTIIEQTMDNDSSAIFFLMPEQNFRDTDELLVVLNQFSGNVHHTTIPSVAEDYLVELLAREGG